MTIKKGIIITAIGVVTLAGAGTLTDSQMNIYTDKGHSFEHVSVEKMKGSGDDVVTFSKTEPKATLTKWNGESSLGISYKEVKANGNRPLLSNKIEWKDGKKEVHAYPVTIDNGKVEGKKKSLIKEAKAQTSNIEEGFEFEVVWNEAPATTTVQFELEGWQDFNFFFQPPLTEEEIADGDIRPDNIVNSWAVYHKTKKNYKEGDVNYGTGKFGHIYRLKAIDANGSWIWVDDVHYENGVITATVDPVWAANAIYPVTVDPTFGYTNIGASTAASNVAFAVRATLSENGDITSISAYVSSAGTSAMGNALYSDASSNPTNLLAQDSGNATVSTAGWYTTNLTYSATAATYWLGLWGQQTDFTRRYDVSGLDAQSLRTGLSFENWPDPFSESSQQGRFVSLYATYTTGGGGEPVVVPRPEVIFFN